MLSGLRSARPSTYAKWQGAHWVLVALAELGYPAGDGSLQPEAGEVLDTWLSRSAYREFTAQTKAAAYCRDGIPVIDGRPRSHASQQGNALFGLTALGLIDDARADALVERVLPLAVARRWLELRQAARGSDVLDLRDGDADTRARCPRRPPQRRACPPRRRAGGRGAPGAPAGFPSIERGS